MDCIVDQHESRVVCMSARYNQHVMLTERQVERVYQARPIQYLMIEYTWCKAAVINPTQKDGNGRYKNTRLSAAAFSTCWLPLTPKSSCTCSLTRGQLLRTQVFHCVGCSALALRHTYKVCIPRWGSTNHLKIKSGIAGKQTSSRANEGELVLMQQ